MYKAKHLKLVVPTTRGYINVNPDGSLWLSDGHTMVWLKQSLFPKAYKYLAMLKPGKYSVEHDGEITVEEYRDPLEEILSDARKHSDTVTITDELRQTFGVPNQLARVLEHAPGVTHHVQECYLEALHAMATEDNRPVATLTTDNKTLVSLKDTDGELIGVIAMLRKP